MFKKRFLALLLVLAMCFTLMPLSALGDTDETEAPAATNQEQESEAEQGVTQAVTPF